MVQAKLRPRLRPPSESSKPTQLRTLNETAQESQLCARYDFPDSCRLLTLGAEFVKEERI